MRAHCCHRAVRVRRSWGKNCSFISYSAETKSKVRFKIEGENHGYLKPDFFKKKLILGTWNLGIQRKM
jgi:hypothetical protein